MKTEVELGVVLASAGPSGPALLDVSELIATRLLVQGNSGSGKSYLLRRLLEQSAPYVQQIIIEAA
jgi:type II secretory pathway predicted ATPase ExeA